MCNKKIWKCPVIVVYTEVEIEKHVITFARSRCHLNFWK